MKRALLSALFAFGLALAAGPVMAAALPGPKVDHHQHLLSPAGAAFLSEGNTLEAKVEVPPDIADLLRRRAAAWNEPSALEPLYTEKAVVTEEGVYSGRKAVAEFTGTRFARPYAITPLSFGGDGSAAQLAAMYTRDDPERPNVGLALFSFAKGSDGKWRIASEAMDFPAPKPLKPLDAADLVKLMDQARIERAVVLSVAYFFQSPLRPPQADAVAKVRAENDWTAAQAARFPTRLVAFCSVNPLTDAALPEIARCKQQLHMAGLKLHLGNSGVDFRKPDQLKKVRAVFAEADRLGMPIVVHLWNGPDFGRVDAQNFLDQVVPGAPHVVIQVAHMAGGGPGWTDEALEVFADAVQKGDPRTKNMYFDVATVADLQTHDQLELLARRIRQIGLGRILYGSDGAFGDHDPPEKEWGNFRGMVPLTDAEFAIIRDNIAPYLRSITPA